MRSDPPTTPPRLSRELGLMVHLCRREPPSRSLVDVALSEISIPTVVGVASRHGVGGSVIGRLTRLLDGQTDLADTERRLRRRDALMREFEADAIEALRARGIEPVVAKGSAIARYYERPHERGATDLDLLVGPTQVAEAIEALGEIHYRGPRSSVRDAYRKSHFHLPVHHRDGHVVEIHWEFVRPSSPFRLDAGVVLRDAIAGRRDESGPTYPVAEHLILLLVLQNLQEGFTRLSRTVDLDRVIAGTAAVRWDELHRTACEGGLRNALAVSLRLCRILLDTPVPRDFEAHIRPPWFARWHLAMERPVETLLRQRLDLTWATQLLFSLWLADRASLAWKRLAAERQLDAEAEALFGRGVGARTLAMRLPKLLAQQLVTYASSAVRPMFGHRSQTLFWSSQASSSDFL